VVAKAEKVDPVSVQARVGAPAPIPARVGLAALA
jgi:hypothetical protein